KFGDEERVELVGGLERERSDPTRSRETRRPGEQRHATPPVARGFRERESHAPARAVGDETDRVEALARRTRRAEEAEPLEIAPASGEPQNLLDDRRGIGHAADTEAAARERPGVGPNETHAPRNERLDVPPNGRVVPHPRLHRRSQEYGAMV